jgi:hypothetical protein
MESSEFFSKKIAPEEFSNEARKMNVAFGERKGRKT